MTQKTMTEKDMFLQQFRRESETTTRLLKAYPANQADLKPAEKSRSAKDLSWVFVIEQGIADMALKGKIDFSQPMPPAPASYAEVVAAFEQSYPETAKKIGAVSEEALNRMIQFPTGPGRMGDFRTIDVLWTMLMDQIHHRGQLSVYLRLAGARVPSIYGPSADETWR
jgi:uncharacterized damage-inducible protein DinB